MFWSTEPWHWKRIYLALFGAITNTTYLYFYTVTVIIFLVSNSSVLCSALHYFLRTRHARPFLQWVIHYFTCHIKVAIFPTVKCHATAQQNVVIYVLLVSSSFITQFNIVWSVYVSRNVRFICDCSNRPIEFGPAFPFLHFPFFSFIIFHLLYQTYIVSRRFKS